MSRWVRAATNLFVDVSPFAARKIELLSGCFPDDSKRPHFSEKVAQALMLTRAVEGFYGEDADDLARAEAFEARVYL